MISGLRSSGPTRRPSPSASTRSAVYGWSPLIGMTTSGTPSDSASFVLLKPPCVMKAAASSSTAICGT